jgi:hypothetical protein
LCISHGVSLLILHLIGCDLDPRLVRHLVPLGGELLLERSITPNALIFANSILLHHGSLGHAHHAAPLAGPFLVGGAERQRCLIVGVTSFLIVAGAEAAVSSDSSQVIRVNVYLMVFPWGFLLVNLWRI